MDKMLETQEIIDAIAAFEKNPNDDTATDVELATRLPGSKAFFMANGAHLSDRLMNALMLADITLDSAPARSSLTDYLSRRIRWRALLSLLRASGHRDAVQSLLDSPPLFSYLTDDYLKNGAAARHCGAASIVDNKF